MLEGLELMLKFSLQLFYPFEKPVADCVLLLQSWNFTQNPHLLLQPAIHLHKSTLQWLVIKSQLLNVWWVVVELLWSNQVWQSGNLQVKLFKFQTDRFYFFVPSARILVKS